MLFFSPVVHSVPDWYLDYTANRKNHLLVGFGEGESIDIAKLAAIREIATQLSVDLKAETKLAIRQRNSVINNRIDNEASIYTSHNLSGVEILKAEQSKEDGRWYVLMRYDSRPVSTKLAESLDSDVVCNDSINQNPHLALFDPVKELNKQIGCHPEVKLRYINGSWNLGVGAIFQPMLHYEFTQFMQPVSSNGITIDSQRTTLHEGESLTFNFQAEKKGYLTCVVVYNSGKVAVLFSNHVVKPTQRIVFPSEESKLELISELEIRGKATSDLYYAVLSNSPRNFSSLEDIGETTIKSNRSYSYGEFLEAVSTDIVSSVLVKTLPTAVPVGHQ